MLIIKLCIVSLFRQIIKYIRLHCNNSDNLTSAIASLLLRFRDVGPFCTLLVHYAQHVHGTFVMFSRTPAAAPNLSYILPKGVDEQNKANYLKLQCVHGSTGIVWHTFSPLYDDISHNPFGH